MMFTYSKNLPFLLFRSKKIKMGIYTLLFGRNTYKFRNNVSIFRRLRSYRERNARNFGRYANKWVRNCNNFRKNEKAERNARLWSKCREK